MLLCYFLSARKTYRDRGARCPGPWPHGALWHRSYVTPKCVDRSRPKAVAGSLMRSSYCTGGVNRHSAAKDGRQKVTAHTQQQVLFVVPASATPFFAIVPQTSASLSESHRTPLPWLRRAIVTHCLPYIYNATDGANWNNKTNWGTDAAVWQWHGVGVNDQASW